MHYAMFGMQALLRFLCTSASKLGYRPLTTPPVFYTATQKRVRVLAPIVAVGARPVFRAKYGKLAVVVKLSSQADIEREVSKSSCCTPCAHSSCAACVHSRCRGLHLL